MHNHLHWTRLTVKILVRCYNLIMKQTPGKLEIVNSFQLDSIIVDQCVAHVICRKLRQEQEEFQPCLLSASSSFSLPGIKRMTDRLECSFGSRRLHTQFACN